MAERVRDGKDALSEEARGAFARARLVVLDVDGVLTDGRIAKDSHGEEQLSFHVHDGIAQQWLQKAGVRVAWITGRTSAAAIARAEELKVDELVVGAKHKGEELRRVQAKLGVVRDATIALGDDLPDLALLGDCALFVAPANARDEVKQRAGLVLASRGGEGAVRELAEHVLRAQERWQAIVDAALR